MSLDFEYFITYKNWLCKCLMRLEMHSTCLLALNDTHNAFWWERLNVNKAVFVYSERSAAYLHLQTRSKKEKRKKHHEVVSGTIKSTRFNYWWKRVCVSLSRREENKVWGYPDAHRSLSRDEREERLHFLDTGLLEAELNFEKCLDWI